MSFGLPARIGGVPLRVVQKQILPISIAGLCVYVVVNRMDDVDLTQVAASIGAVTAVQWIAAILATAVSFVAVGQYDALFHRWLKTGVADKRAVLSGASAIALAQTLGMGLATGTLARWRALPELSLATSLKVTNYVSFSFMAGLGLLSIVVLALPGVGHIGASWYSLAAVAVVLVAVNLSFLQPKWLPFPLPPLRMALRLMVLATIDIIFAAFALWVLFPGGSQLGFTTLLAVFTLSLGAGLLSGSPGGVGPFELCLFTLMPAFPEPELIASVLAFRLVYYALPACLAVITLIKPSPAPFKTMPTTRSARRPLMRAEAKLAQQAGHRFLPYDDERCLHVAEATQTLVAIGDPATGSTFGPSAFATLGQAADKLSLWPALYKCSARSAVFARSVGWSAIPVSEEAWLSPNAFTLATPARRQLRRKLKKAAQAQIDVSVASTLPLAEMEMVSAAWSKRAGGERGFSMGVFSEDHVTRQRCYLARNNGALVAFISFHTVQNEWTLDLMRSTSDMPDGAMHALVVQALEDAAERGIPRLSLAAMALDDPHFSLKHFGQTASAKGLRQFKTSFAPRTERLYAAAPSTALLYLAGADITLRIATQVPLVGAEPETREMEQRPA
ncbi:phosphatidylglycerol lysyltransferase domain-containing protein [Rhodobacteraceae bacterium]|nr:phosphatidylglycerol lysyltransferase domain-containing protein [Paracoccaceae bacterium]